MLGEPENQFFPRPRSAKSMRARKKQIPAISALHPGDFLAPVRMRILQSEPRYVSGTDSRITTDDCVRSYVGRHGDNEFAEQPAATVAQGNPGRDGTANQEHAEAMSFQCVQGHHWTGCRCDRCGALRDAEHQWIGDTCQRCGRTRASEVEEVRKFVEEEMSLGLAGDWIARPSPFHRLTWKIVPRETPPGEPADRDYELWVASDLSWSVFLYGNSDATSSPVERVLLSAVVVWPPRVRSHYLAIAARNLVPKAPPNRWPARITTRCVAADRSFFLTAEEATACVERELSQEVADMGKVERCEKCELGWRIRPSKLPPDWDRHLLAEYQLSITKDLELLILNHGPVVGESAGRSNCHVIEPAALGQGSLGRAVRHVVSTHWPGASELGFRCPSCGGEVGFSQPLRCQAVTAGRRSAGKQG